jgi:hypothetical protein
MHLFKNEINRRGSASWLLCNDNSKSGYFREKFIQENGGKFTKNGRTWEWSEDTVTVPTAPPEPHKNLKKWIFLDAEGNQHIVYNLTEFATKNNLSRQKLYDLLKGERKSHKGYTFVSKHDPEENPA